ncbi:MAG TPA: M20/M25/M40 family metallo-hydrolase, partial [Thermoleophilia bacterium]|nr:M20/M25/M40 family metallo-hydrolase [Thermoleophilia bacterium]
MSAEKHGGARTYLLAALVVAVVAGLVILGVTPLGAPRPQTAGAPATTFSATRALGELRLVAATPHPIGSQAESQVRATIVARLQALGLSPHVQTSGVVSQEDGRVAGTVHNLLARLPGSDPTRTVLLVAHYDSVAVAPGAADDGGGVATLLETARALSAGPLPRNDIVFLFTDGEEKGLLGARAFLRDDPWAYGVGVVLNFDSPGSSSPALMYETTSGNGVLVGTLLGAGPPVFASSLMYEVARRQPVETDFRRFKAAGVPGMSFGALDGPADDHTGYDSLRTFRLASLQHEGDTALALARRFGAMDLWNLHAPDRVYFDIVGGYAVSYGAGLVWPLVVVAAALFAAAVVVAWRRRRVTLHGIVVGVPASSLVLGVALAVVGIVWGMYRPAYEQRVWTNTGVVVSDFHRLGLVLLAAAVVAAAYGLLLRRLSPWDLAVAALFWWLAAAVVLAVTVPTATYLLTWPLAAASVGFLGAALLGDRVFSSAWV